MEKNNNDLRYLLHNVIFVYLILTILVFHIKQAVSLGVFLFVLEVSVGGVHSSSELNPGGDC